VNEVLGTMLALGVGIDYSLLIINRHRQLRADGKSVTDSIGEAWSTTGTSVALAAATVCVATGALLLVGVPLVTKLGLTSAMFVAIPALAALTLLPALLAAAGEQLDRWALPWASSESRFWPRWASINARLRWPLAIVPLAILAVAFFPVPSADLGIIDDGSLPESVTQRRAYDDISEGFGPGANGPLIVVAQVPTGTDTADLRTACESLVRTIRQVDGVASASPAKVSGATGGTLCGLPEAVTSADEASTSDTAGATSDTATESAPSAQSSLQSFVFRVIPTTGPDDPATTALVETLRQTVVPSAVSATVLDADTVYVGGQTAIFIDFTNRIKDRLPLYIGVVLLLAFVLLMTAFRSIVIPVKAALMALVSFLAAYGITIAVFQWGWMKGLVGLQDTVPIETFFPLMLFAILFGLSMDYEVFLVSRIHEEVEAGTEPGEAVTTGLATTGKIILSAGLIMTSVFLAFTTNPSPVVKQLAFGLAVAVAIDAIVIRLVVVPALLHLFGRETWWLPRWLDRILPHVRIG
jgi:RND superfamily putative drug exporter